MTGTWDPNSSTRNSALRCLRPGTSTATVFSDVLVGTLASHGFLDYQGRVYAYHGSANGLSQVKNWTMGSNAILRGFASSVATAGDVNGDGFSDVVVGHHTYTSGQVGEGRALVYYGNEGAGLDRTARQVRADDAAPIALLGTSDSPSSFRIEALGRTPAGRGRIRLQCEVKPFGVPFDGTQIVTSAAFDTGVPVVGAGSSVPFSELVSVSTPGTLYHWRTRVVAGSPFFPRSPWFSQVGNAPSEADLRTAEGTTAVGEVASSTTTRLLLEPTAPNPFAGSTRIAYSLPERGPVRLAIYDVAGRQVAKLEDGVREQGRYTQTWDGRGTHGTKLSAGVYFARLEFAGRSEVRKIVLVR